MPDSRLCCTDQRVADACHELNRRIEEAVPLLALAGYTGLPAIDVEVMDDFEGDPRISGPRLNDPAMFDAGEEAGRKPRILVNASTFVHLVPADQVAVLAHEYAHFVRRTTTLRAIGAMEEVETDALACRFGAEDELVAERRRSKGEEYVDLIRRHVALTDDILLWRRRRAVKGRKGRE